MDILNQLASDLFKHLQAMDGEANSSAGYCFHAGLNNYSIYKGLSGKKYENSWNDRLAELLGNNGNTTSREFRYPDSKKKCDIVIKSNNGKSIWLEVKSAWKYWFSSTSGKLEKNSPQIYRSYLLGNSANTLNKTHSVVQDIEKLSLLDSNLADYIGLLIIGFDIQEDPIDPDMEELIETMNLKEQGWKVFGPEIWLDRNHPDCRYNCWFLGKKSVYFDNNSIR